MATKSTDAPETTGPKAPAGPLDPTATLQAYRFNVMTGMGVAWLEAIGDMGSEVMSFVADRIKEDVKTQHRLLHCKDLTELQTIQAEFVKNAVEQYNAETGKLVKMSAELFPGAETPDKS